MFLSPDSKLNKSYQEKDNQRMAFAIEMEDLPCQVWGDPGQRSVLATNC